MRRVPAFPSLLAFAFAFAIWTPARSSAAAAAPASPASPGSDLHTLTFSRLVVRLGAGDDIGVGKEELRVFLLEELRARGFPALGAESLVFGKDRGAEARFQLGGTVTEAACATETSIFDGGRPCSIAVVWELMDGESDRVVYKVLTRNRLVRHREGPDPNLARDLLLGAFRSLLRRPKFLHALERTPGAPMAAPAHASARFRACGSAPIALPAGAEAAVKAVVTIETPTGHGSGVLVSPDGLVLTAAHVVRAATDVTLRLHDGSKLSAFVVRSDDARDVALVRAATPPAACLPLRADAPRLGEEVYAIGTPLDPTLAFSLTRGIVSGLREVNGAPAVQTDASVNAGNSGGPLVDASGRVLAIIGSKLVGSGVEGVAFGLPVAVALERLGLASGAGTDPALLARAATPGGPQVSLVEDIADGAAPVSLVAAAPTIEARPSRQPGAHVGPRAVAHLGLAIVGAGGMLVLGRYAADALLDTPTDTAARRRRRIGHVGWGAVTLGGALVVGAFAVELDRRPARAAGGPAPPGSLSLGVGAGSVQVGGRF